MIPDTTTERAFRLIQSIIDGRADELPALLSTLEQSELVDLTAVSLVFAADSIVAGDSLESRRAATAKKVGDFIERLRA